MRILSQAVRKEHLVVRGALTGIPVESDCKSVVCFCCRAVYSQYWSRSRHMARLCFDSRNSLTKSWGTVLKACYLEMVLFLRSQQKRLLEHTRLSCGPYTNTSLISKRNLQKLRSASSIMVFKYSSFNN